MKVVGVGSNFEDWTACAAAGKRGSGLPKGNWLGFV